MLTKIKYLTAGESHGKGLLGIIENHWSAQNAPIHAIYWDYWELLGNIDNYWSASNAPIYVIYCELLEIIEKYCRKLRGPEKLQFMSSIGKCYTLFGQLISHYFHRISQIPSNLYNLLEMRYTILLKLMLMHSTSMQIGF